MFVCELIYVIDFLWLENKCSIGNLGVVGCHNPTLRECEDEIHTPEMGTWKSFGTPESLEFNCKSQNSSPWGILYIIRKLLKCRCPKWARMTHLDICNTSYGQVGNQVPTRFPCVQVACDMSLKSSQRGLQLWFRPRCNWRSAPEVIVP